MADPRDIPDTDDDDIPLEGNTNGHANGGAANGERFETVDNGIGNGAALSPVNNGRIQQDDKKNEQPVEWEIVETDDNGRPLGGQPQRQQDDRLAAQEGDGTYIDRQRQQQQQRRDGQQNERLSSSQRRKQQQRARAFNEQENANLRAELADMRQRLDGFVPHIQRFDATPRQNEIARIDGEIQAAGRALQDAQRRSAEAVQKLALGEAGAVDEFQRAQTEQLQAAIRGERATMAKSNLERTLAQPAEQQRQTQQPQRQQPQQQATEAQPIAINEQGKRLSQEFLARNSWIDPSPDNSDTISKAALAIDAQVLNEGYNPNTPAYWNELENRLAEVMPYKFEQDQQDGRQQGRQQPQRQTQQRQAQPQVQRRGPMAGASEGGAPRRQQVAVTPGRKQALLDAGVIDNTGRVTNKTKFTRIMQQFHEFDAQQVATQ